MFHLVKVVKAESSKWVNDNHFTPHKFAWQEGFGAFSYAKSQVPMVIKYIQNQETHRRKQNFIDEYTAFLNAFGIDYEVQYIFKPLLEE